MPSLKPPLKINPPRLDLQPQGGTSKRGDRSPPFAWSVSRRGVFQGEREIEIPLPLNGVLPPLPTWAKEVAPQSEIFRADDIRPYMMPPTNDTLRRGRCPQRPASGHMGPPPCHSVATRENGLPSQSADWRAMTGRGVKYLLYSPRTPPELYGKIHILEIMGKVCPKLALPAPKNAQKNRPVTKDGPVCVLLCLIFSDLRPRRRTCPSSPCSRPCCHRWPEYRP